MFDKKRELKSLTGEISTKGVSYASIEKLKTTDAYQFRSNTSRQKLKKKDPGEHQALKQQ